jgi:hypothetical protein
MAKETGTRKVGRPRTGWTQIGLKLAPGQLAKLDVWRAQNGGLARPEAIRQLMRRALDAIPEPAPDFGGVDLAIRDRVRSDIYGLGSIVELIHPRSDQPMVQATVAVRWDSREWGIVNMPPNSLQFVRRPQPL